MLGQGYQVKLFSASSQQPCIWSFQLFFEKKTHTSTSSQTLWGIILKKPIATEIHPEDILLDPKWENWFGWFFQCALHHMPVSTECMLNPSGVQCACVGLSEKELVLLSHFLLSQRQFCSVFSMSCEHSATLKPVSCNLQSDVKFVQQQLNKCHPAIQWDVSFSFSGKRVVFLDLDISLAQGQFAIQTYRKPQNAYLYIPRTSCHPKSVYTALIVGETQRLLRHNCQNAGRLRHHIGFFLRRLQLRGFSVAECSLFKTSL